MAVGAAAASRGVRESGGSRGRSARGARRSGWLQRRTKTAPCGSHRGRRGPASADWPWHRVPPGDVATPSECGPPWVATERAWLDATWDAEYPDARIPTAGPVSLSPDRRSVVVARSGFDFREGWEVPEHRAGHGSLTRDTCRRRYGPATPPRGTDPYRRSVSGDAELARCRTAASRGRRGALGAQPQRAPDRGPAR